MIDQDGFYADDKFDDDTPGRTPADWQRLLADVRAGTERNARALELVDQFFGDWTVATRTHADSVAELEPDERATLTAQLPALESTARRAATLAAAMNALARAIRG